MKRAGNEGLQGKQLVHQGAAGDHGEAGTQRVRE